MTVEKLQTIRRWVFLIIGLTCLLYAGIYLVLGMSDILNPFLPGVIGLAGGLILVIASLIGGHSVAEAVFDEMSRAEWGRALRFGYWWALALYPVFGLLLWRGLVDQTQAFAVMGTLTGGVPLLYYCWLDMRGQGHGIVE
ncbi:MAG: hypothetical protein L3J36_01240 [Rhodobacteraceae bacterium]|nr:hypothetical protein [Paracoccaceae bacterium]